MSRRRSSITFSTADNLKLWQCGVQQTERKEDRSFVAMLPILTFDSAPTGSAPTRQQIRDHWLSKRFKDYVSSEFGANAYEKLVDENSQILRQNKSQKNKSQIEKQRTQQENQQKRKKQKQEAKELQKHEKQQMAQQRQHEKQQKIGLSSLFLKK